MIGIDECYTSQKTSLNFGDPFLNLYAAFLFNSAILCFGGTNTAVAITHDTSMNITKKSTAPYPKPT
jgi:hypothetical protein